MGTRSGLDRRAFLRLSAGVTATAVVGSSLWQRAFAALGPVVDGPGPYGPLEAADANGLRLPAGFQSQVVAVSGETVPGTSYVWHVDPDGGATFRTDDGWIYVSNSENFAAFGGPNAGGAGALRFDHRGAVTDAYRILDGNLSLINCAGGATPWGTWISCEEYFGGFAWECDPTGATPAVRRDALGIFSHEAVAVDPAEQRLYLTEDEGDGLLYRFTPDVYPDLSSGLLEAAEAVNGGPGPVVWHPVPRPVPSSALLDPVRFQLPQASGFDGGEGIVCDRGVVYFTTKGDNRVWAYTPETATLAIIHEPGPDALILRGVDNLAAGRSGDLLVAEDGGDMQLVLLSPEGTVSPIVQIEGQDGSEITGPAFDPWGHVLYFSSQRGARNGRGRGITYAVTGPFRQFVPGSGMRCAGPAT